MPEPRIVLRSFLRTALALAPAAAVIIACSDSASTSPGGADGGDAAAPAKDAARSTDGASGDPADAGPKTTCSITLAYYEACNNTGELPCDQPNFDAWCAKNDETNSDAFRRAEATCLSTDNCDANKRRDCEYAHYNDEALTHSQSELVSAYCTMCEPSDPSGCKTRATHYDTTATVGDVFVAAWEFSDAIVDEMRTKCTGLDGGVDAGGCAKAFGSCTADVYFAHLPDCPK